MSGGHGHDADAGDEIVLHQETLWPTMLLALAFAVIALFGLSQAGQTKIDLSIGKTAYEKIEAAKPKSNKEVAVPMNNPTATYKAPGTGEQAKTEPATSETKPEEAKTEQPKTEEHK